MTLPNLPNHTKHCRKPCKEYDILHMEIMCIKNRLNVLESAGTYQRTTTYIDPRIKVEK